eukprot:scaffold13029_cov45-Phaeocystis_antarctica.AAC.1
MRKLQPDGSPGSTSCSPARTACPSLLPAFARSPRAARSPSLRPGAATRRRLAYAHPVTSLEQRGAARAAQTVLRRVSLVLFLCRLVHRARRRARAAHPTPAALHKACTCSSDAQTADVTEATYRAAVAVHVLQQERPWA